MVRLTTVGGAPLEGCYVPPSGKAAVGEGFLTAGIGCPLGRTWPTARAVAPLLVDPTQGSETGKVRGLCWHNPPRERKGSREGKIGQGGRGRTQGVRGTTAYGGKGSRASGRQGDAAAACAHGHRTSTGSLFTQDVPPGGQNGRSTHSSMQGSGCGRVHPVLPGLGRWVHQ